MKKIGEQNYIPRNLSDTFLKFAVLKTGLEWPKMVKIGHFWQFE